jgi:hypothetical protein
MVRGAQGDVAAARALLDMALPIRTRANGPAHPKTADCLELIASLPAPPDESADAAKVRREEAARLLERVVTIRAAALGEDHLETAAARRRLADAVDE